MLPNPPFPRSVFPTSATLSNEYEILFSNIHCAILSPLLISYGSSDKLDLEKDTSEYSNLESSANLHYNEFLDTQLNGGNAKASYGTRNKLDLGDSGVETC